MNPKTAILASTFFLGAIIAPEVSAQISLTDHLAIYGDIRFGYYGQVRNELDGSRIQRHELRLRTRTGLVWKISDRLETRIRYAGRFSSIDPEFRPGLTTTAVRNNGLNMGELAFDEAYLSFAYSGKTLFKAGRFTTQYTLPGVIGNAIIRNDAPSTDLQWTDGLFVSHQFETGWKADIIAQVHYGNWSTNTVRFPLDYSSENSWLTLFSSVSRSARSGRLRLLGMEATFSPNALRVDAVTRDHYSVVSGKVALGWETENAGDIIWGFEAAWSIVRPYKNWLGFDGHAGEKAGGTGFQTNLSFVDFIASHSIGFIFAVLEPSFLTSEDYWNNIVLAEIRHVWRINDRLSTETRMRFRGDLHKYTNAIQKRGELIPYARLTYRFR